jgi:hypothetical protein
LLWRVACLARRLPAPALARRLRGLRVCDNGNFV